MKIWGTLAVGVIGSIIAFYLCEKVFPLLGMVVTNHPFQSFVVFALIVIIILLIVLANKQIKANANPHERSDH